MASGESLTRLRNNLTSSYDFSVRTAFELVGAGRQLRAEEFMEFMRGQGIELSREEAGCLYKVVDPRGLGQASTQMLADFIALKFTTPKEDEIFDECEVLPKMKDR
jgi:hypothetical protein